MKPGDLLVTLDSPEVQAKLSQAEAARAAAAAKQQLLDVRHAAGGRAHGACQLGARGLGERTWRKRPYKRINALYEDGLVSQQRNDEVETAYRSALDAANAARAQYDHHAATDSARRNALAAAEVTRGAGAAVKEVGRPGCGHLAQVADLGGGRQASCCIRASLHRRAFPIISLVESRRRVGGVQPARGRAGDDQDRYADHRQGARPGRPQRHVLRLLHQPQGRIRDLARDAAVERLRHQDLRGSRAARSRRCEGLRPGMSVLVERS